MYNTSVTTPLTGDEAMYFLKQHLTTNLWMVVESGDGRMAYGVGDMLYATSGSNSFDEPGAWCRLQMPGTTREYLIIRKSDSRSWTIRYSVAGFTGGSPSATVAPTAADQQTIWNATLLPPEIGRASCRERVSSPV